MIALRLASFLALTTIEASPVMYLFTRDRRYVKFAWRVLQLAFIFLIVFMVFYVLERLVMVV